MYMAKPRYVWLSDPTWAAFKAKVAGLLGPRGRSNDAVEELDVAIHLDHLVEAAILDFVKLDHDEALEYLRRRRSPPPNTDPGEPVTAPASS